MEKFKKAIIIILFFLISFSPVFAQVDIWAGTGPPGSPTCNIEGPCTFCDLLIVASNIYNDLALPLALSIAVLMIIIGGVMLLISAGSEDKYRKAKNTLTMAITGLIIVLASWLIVNTLINLIAGGNALPFPWYSPSCP